MKTYARIITDVVSKVQFVAEIISPMQGSDGNEMPIGERFTPAFVAALIDVTDANPQPQQRWAYDGSTFSEP